MASAKRLQGKVAVITASTDGIGLAIAERFCREGARVVISSRKQANVARRVQELRDKGLEATGVVCHVGKADDRDRLLKTAENTYGGVDILVSNAAVSPYFGPFMKTTEKVWDRVFDINVKATFLLIQAAVPYLEKRGGGSIIINSSIGAYRAGSNLGAYGISKTALLGLTRVLAVSLARDNIRVNCIAPGVIKTKLSEALWKSPQPEAHRSLAPMQRYGEPHECAGAAAFLASEDSSYITGETLVIAGGEYSRL